MVKFYEALDSEGRVTIRLNWDTAILNSGEVRYIK